MWTVLRGFGSGPAWCHHVTTGCPNWTSSFVFSSNETSRFLQDFLPLSVLFIELWSCCFNPPPTPSLLPSFYPSFPSFPSLHQASFPLGFLFPAGSLLLLFLSPLPSLWPVHPSSFHSVITFWLTFFFFNVFISPFSSHLPLPLRCSCSSSCTHLPH